MGREARVRKLRHYRPLGIPSADDAIMFATAKEFAEQVALKKRADAIGIVLACTIVPPTSRGHDG